MKTGKIWVTLTVIMVISMVLASCGSSTTTASTTSTSATTQTNITTKSNTTTTQTSTAEQQLRLLLPLLPQEIGGVLWVRQHMGHIN